MFLCKYIPLQSIHTNCCNPFVEPLCVCVQTAIQKDGSWLKGYHRKACAHQAMGERGIALETYRHALEIEPKNK